MSPMSVHLSPFTNHLLLQSSGIFPYNTTGPQLLWVQSSPCPIFINCQTYHVLEFVCVDALPAGSISCEVASRTYHVRKLMRLLRAGWRSIKTDASIVCWRSRLMRLIVGWRSIKADASNCGLTFKADASNCGLTFKADASIVGWRSRLMRLLWDDVQDWCVYCELTSRLMRLLWADFKTDASNCVLTFKTDASNCGLTFKTDASIVSWLQDWCVYCELTSRLMRLLCADVQDCCV